MFCEVERMRLGGLRVGIIIETVNFVGSGWMVR